MPRRAVTFTQADVRRIIAAAKQAGAAKVEIRVGNEAVFVHLNESTESDKPVERAKEIVL